MSRFINVSELDNPQIRIVLAICGIVAIFLYLQYYTKSVQSIRSNAPVKYVKPPKPMPVTTDFTLEKLAEFDGVKNMHEGNPIYISLRGKVFDVTSHPGGRGFYGPEGPYGLFAGHDATVPLATMEIDRSLLDKKPDAWNEFTLLEQQTLAEWISKFENKYDVVGNVTF